MVVGRTLEKLQTTVDEIKKQGGIAIAEAGDVSCEADVIASVEKCMSEFGGLGVSFANAGAWIGAIPVFEQRVEQWQDIFRINAIGSFLALKHAGAYMANQGSGGSLIFMSSVAALRGDGGDAAYSAAKASVKSLTQTGANELAGINVRVNAIASGLVETEGTSYFFDAARAKGVAEKIGKNNPLRRPGRPEEIAAVAAFLASEESSYIDGQITAVDGGVSSTHPFGRTP
ncbi:MAG: SDR family NAD(P)-dependent oxidoreductase [Porticoccaceae bacterium]